MTAVRSFLRSMVLTAGAILGTVCLLWTLGVLVAGVTPLVVLSGSMSPTLEAGDVAFARSTPATDIDIGDVVSVTDGDGVRVTHRVDEARASEPGRVTLVLRGDANGSADAESYSVAVVDRVVGHAPGLGFILLAAGTPWGIAAGSALLVSCLALGLRAPRPDEDDEPPAGECDSRGGYPRPRSSARTAGGIALVIVSLVGVGSASAPQQSLAYFTDKPTVSSSANAIDSAPWFTCHQAMTSTELSAFAYYRFNDAAGSTTAADSSGNNRTATMGGAAGTGYAFGQPQPCARDTDTAVKFATPTSFAASPNVAQSGGAAGARWNTFTLSLWFRGDAANTGGVLIALTDAANGAGSAHDRKIYVDSAGRLRFGVYNGTAETLATPASGASGYIDFRAGAWHMVTASLSPGGMKLFVDGERLALTTTERGTAASAVTSAFQYATTAYWNIGSASNGGWPGGTAQTQWKGSISKVGIWDRALTDQQIRDLYRSGIPVH